MTSGPMWRAAVPPGRRAVAIGVVPAIYAALDGNLASYVDAQHDRHGPRAARAEVID